jgi:hypothetical protein
VNAAPMVPLGQTDSPKVLQIHNSTNVVGFRHCGEALTNRRKNWLGGLDSNQDSQIQSLESYQLDDLPTEAIPQ